MKKQDVRPYTVLFKITRMWNFEDSDVLANVLARVEREQKSIFNYDMSKEEVLDIISRNGGLDIRWGPGPILTITLTCT